MTWIYELVADHSQQNLPVKLGGAPTVQR